MSPLELLRRITRLIPPAGLNLVRYFGILAPAAKYRRQVAPVPKVDVEVSPNALEPVLPPMRSQIDWASLLRRVYDVDIFACPCGGRIRIISVIEQPAVIHKILDHLGLPRAPPEVALARAPPEQGEFDYA